MFVFLHLSVLKSR